MEHPRNYLIVKMTIGKKEVLGLIDSGAQPNVIKESKVPIGTIIKDSTATLKGVKGPGIKVRGLADIPVEIGNLMVSIPCFIVADRAMHFPAKTSVILGTNAIVENELDISTRKWALFRHDKLVKNLQPTWVNGKLFSRAEADYAEHSEEGKDVSQDSEDTAEDHDSDSTQTSNYVKRVAT